MTPRPHTGGPNMAFRASEKSAPECPASLGTLGHLLVGLVYTLDSPQGPMLSIGTWASITLMGPQV